MEDGERETAHLFQALFAEGTLGRVVQAALQAVLAEGVAARRCHGLVKHPASAKARRYYGNTLKTFIHFIQLTRHLQTPYLMQSEHSKSLASSRSLGNLLRVFSLEGFFLELCEKPKINRQDPTMLNCTIIGLQFWP